MSIGRLDYRALFFCSMLYLMVSACSNSNVKQSNDGQFPQDLALVMEHMRDYTLAVYDMPADSNMSFRPTEEVMTFQEHAAHMLSNMHLQNECFVKRDTVTNIDFVMEDVADILAIEDRAILRERLKSQFDDIIHELKQLNGKENWNKQRMLPQFDGKPQKDLITILMMMRDHITHHRGQMIVYLRLMGQVPPRYKPF